MARHVALAALAALLLVPGAGAAAAPRFGGAVVIGSPSSPPACLRPYSGVCRQGVFPDPIWRTVLAGAFEPREDLTYAPDLAEATFTRDPFTVTYRIRPQARWSDGTPVTAGDFAFTFRTVIASELGPEDAWRRIRRVVQVDAKTVRVVFRLPTADWQRLFDPVLPRHALEGEDFAQVWRDEIENPKTGRPIGSGPFLVQRWERGKELTLVRNPAYWGARKAYLDRLLFRWVPADPLAALRTGQADVMIVGGRPEIVTELRREPDFRILVNDRALSWEQLTIRVGAGGHRALREKAVRQALAFGIDRVAIVRDLFGDVAPGLRPLESALFLATERSYRASWSRYAYRPAEAERLLDRAGCRRGVDGIRACDGERLTLRFVTNAGVQRRQRTLELVRAHLRRIGVEAVPEYVTQRNMFGPGGVLARGAFDLALVGWSRTGGEVADGGVFLCTSELNFAGHCSRLIDRDLQQVPRLLDPAERGKVLHSADRKLAEAVPVIPLYQSPNVIAVRRAVRGVPAHPFFAGVSYRAEDWWLDRGR